MFMCSYINVHYIAKCFHVICTCKDMRIGRRQRRCSVEDCALREHVNQTEVLHTTVYSGQYLAICQSTRFTSFCQGA